MLTAFQRSSAELTLLGKFHPVLLSVSDLRKSFGPGEVLSGVSFRLMAREKAALVGRNGCGKTTLLRILSGEYESDAGCVWLQRGAKVGYLRQEAPITEGFTVLQEAQAARRHAMELKARLEELEARMAEGPTDDELDEYALVHEHFLESEGYSAEHDVTVVLRRMGFEEHEFSRLATSLSGGEKTRLALARLLLEEPDLLILDEPTNHLDLRAVEWLESWVRSYHGAVLLCSHDRSFLENTAERVLDLRDGVIRSYAASFAKYRVLRAEEEARQAEVAKRQEAEIARMDEYVRRFMNSQRTAQARGRQKFMNRLIESRTHAPTRGKTMKAAFGVAKCSGEVVFEANKLSAGYPGAALVKNLNWTVRSGERWGIIGENGAGKSTLIKTLLGLLEPLEGQARIGVGVVAGYFAQDVADLNVAESPLETLMDEGLRPQEARDLLSRFLLTGEDVFRPVRTLSGGEKNKLELARLTCLTPNVLVLDEPTNHLDLDSREALADVLREFAGALVLVSHDRSLLDAVTDHTLDVRQDGVTQYPGSYAEYSDRMARGAARPAPEVGKGEGLPSATECLSPRERSKAIQRQRKAVEVAEAGVAALEAELKALETRLAAPEPDADVVALSRRHGELAAEVEMAVSAWESEATRLQEISD